MILYEAGRTAVLLREKQAISLILSVNGLEKTICCL